MIEGYDNKLLQTFEYETTAISNKKIIGTCELGKATIQLINDSNTYSDLKKTWIKTKFGSFYIDNVEPVQEKVNIKLSCYDIKYKLDSEYDSDLYTWPQTLKKWRNAIFDNCGVEYDDSDFPNSDLILNYEPDLNNSKTNRQVLCIIAQAGASWIETDENDKFFFKWFTENVFVAKDWSSLTTEKQASSSINLVILSRGDVGDDVYYPKTKPSNPVEFKIENNYILDPQSILNTEDLRETTIIPIYNQVNGFSYIVFNLTSTLIDKKLSIKLGDKIKYTDIWGNELTSYVMSRKISYIGGDIEDDDNYQITLSAEEIEETNTELSTGTNVIEEMKTISRKADKNTGLIEDLVEETEDITNEINKTNTDVNNNYQDLLNKLNDCAKGDDIVDLKKSVEILQSSTDYTITVLEDIQVNGVSKVETETGYVFDKEGLSIDKTDAPTGGKFNEAGMEIVDKLTAALTTLFYSGYVNEEMAQKVDALTKYMGQTVTYTNSLIFQKYLSSMNMRLEDIEHDVFGKGLGFFTIGDDE